jgi:hypothetical protein
VFVAAAWPCGVAYAAFEEWAIGVKSGTLGIGGDLTTNLVPDVHLRAGVQWFELDVDMEIDDIDYDVDLTLLNPLLLLDWYPFAGDFRISAGVLLNASDIDLEATSADAIEIGGSFYEPEEFGSIRGGSDFEEIAPYIGIGFGNHLSQDRRWGLSADIGVAFVGSPNVDLRVTGPLADFPPLLADLAEEEREIEDKLDKYKFYPVLALTLYYRF